MAARIHTPDTSVDLAAHAKACEAAHKWAEKARELRSEGRTSEASAAERRAMLFMSRVLELEARCPPLARTRRAGGRDRDL